MWKYFLVNCWLIRLGQDRLGYVRCCFSFLLVKHFFALSKLIIFSIIGFLCTSGIHKGKILGWRPYNRQVPVSLKFSQPRQDGKSALFLHSLFVGDHCCFVVFIANSEVKKILFILVVANRAKIWLRCKIFKHRENPYVSQHRLRKTSHLVVTGKKNDPVFYNLCKIKNLEGKRREGLHLRTHLLSRNFYLLISLWSGDRLIVWCSGIIDFFILQVGS